MLKAVNLTKIYRAKKGVETVALDNVNLSFGESGMVFILGKSGSGKSTLLNLSGGLIRPTSGDVYINGRAGKTFKDGELDAYRNTAVGFVFQEYNLIENYTVGTNIKLALELQGKKADRECIDELLLKTGLTESNGETFYGRYVHELSGGQKQRVAVARALIKEPEIILADEPTGALDSVTGEELYELLKELSGERLIIVVTHDEESARKYGDRIIELEDGKVISDSAPYEAVNLTEEREKTYQKSRIAVKYAFLTGVKSLVKSPFSLSVSLILTFISLVILGFMLSVNFCDVVEADLKTMRSQNITTVRVEKRYLNEEQRSYLSEYLDGRSYGLYVENSYGSAERLINHINLGNYEDRRNPYDSFGKDIEGIVEIDAENGENEFGLTADSRFADKSLCRLPRNLNEIAITDLELDLYIRYGYRTDGGEIIKITKPDDMIGRTMDGYTVCGVYSTEVDRELFKQLDEDYYGMTRKEIDEFKSGIGVWYHLDNRMNTYKNGLKYSLVNKIFVAEGFIEKFYEEFIDYREYDENNLSIFFRLSGDYEKDYELLKKIESCNVYVPSMVEGFPGKWYTYDGYNSFVSYFSRYPINFWEYLDTHYALIPSCALAVLVTLNFLLVSVDMRNRELKILRSLGAGKNCVRFICLVEGLILSLVNFVLSVAGIFIACAVMNAIYYAQVFTVNIGLVGILFGASAVLSLLSALFASLFVTGKKL